MGNRFRILLINPPSLCVEDDRLEPPLGLLYVAAAARQAGYEEISICDLAGCGSEEEIEEHILQIPQADVFGLGVLCTTHRYVKKIVAHIRNVNPSAYIILGGPNASVMPEFTLTDIQADAVVVGEGEDAMIQCLASYSAGQRLRGIVPGVARENVDSYPFPARDLIQFGSYSRKLLGRPVVSVISSRGCPYRCIFCNSPVMGGGAPSARFRSPENLIAEIESLRDRFRNFRMNDDCFTGHPRLGEVLDRLTHLDLRFRSFARVEHLKRETCFALKRAGCVHVSVGLESMNPANLRILGKASQIGKEHFVQFAHEAGLIVRASFMVGLPYDNEQNIDKYFHQAAELGLDEFSIYPLIPYPGTKIARHPDHFGYAIINPDFRTYVQIGAGGASCYALQHRNFGPEVTERMRQRAIEILCDSGAVPSKASCIAQ